MTERTPASSLLARPAVRAILAAALLAILVGVMLIARSFRDEAKATVERRPSVSITVTPESGLGAIGDDPPIVGAPAPAFALRDLGGNRVALSDYRGKVVWINFWATWCTPCKKELPDIQKLVTEKADQGLVVLAINYQEGDSAARTFMDNAGLTLPVLLDRSGSVYNQYRLQGLPDSFFVGRDGNLEALQYGYMTEKKMRERLRDAGIE